MEIHWILAGAAAVLGLVGILLRRYRTGATGDSKRAHEAATQRTPPVALGETYEFGISEFTDHHSGERVAVGKVEGFVLFAENVPEEASVGDVARVKVLSFNEGRTSADATVLEVS